MISVVDKLPQISFDSVPLARIKCTFAAYGDYEKIACFWVQTTDINNEVLALLSLMDDNLTVFAHSVNDELIGFINMLNPASVFTDLPTADALNIKGKRLCAAASLSVADTGEQGAVDTELIYELFSENFGIGNRQLFLADVSHRLRHNCAVAMTEPGGAAFMQFCEDCAYITGIAVKSEFRGQKIGSNLLKKLKKMPKNIKIYACFEQELLPFYSKNGFEQITPCVLFERK